MLQPGADARISSTVIRNNTAASSGALCTEMEDDPKEKTRVFDRRTQLTLHNVTQQQQRRPAGWTLLPAEPQGHNLPQRLVQAAAHTVQPRRCVAQAPV